MDIPSSKFEISETEKIINFYISTLLSRSKISLTEALEFIEGFSKDEFESLFVKNFIKGKLSKISLVIKAYLDLVEEIRLFLLEGDPFLVDVNNKIVGQKVLEAGITLSESAGLNFIPWVGEIRWLKERLDGVYERIYSARYKIELAEIMATSRGFGAILRAFFICLQSLSSTLEYIGLDPEQALMQIRNVVSSLNSADWPYPSEVDIDMTLQYLVSQEGSVGYAGGSFLFPNKNFVISGLIEGENLDEKLAEDIYKRFVEILENMPSDNWIQICKHFGYNKYEIARFLKKIVAHPRFSIGTFENSIFTFIDPTQFT